MAAVANLKDHLKEFARNHGRDAEEVETAIEGSTPLKILIDLHNSEKHGEWNPRKGRSGLHPRLAEVTRAVRFRGDGKTAVHSLRIPLRPGEPARASGNVASVIVADVLDENGQKIGDGDFVGMIAAALADWERLLSSWGVTLPKKA